MTLLVGEGADVDGQSGTGQGESGDDAQRTVEPTRLVLRLDVAARQQMRPGPRVPTEDIADAVNRGIQPARGQAVEKPVSRFHVLRRESRPMYAGAELTDLAQFVQVTQEGVGVDHGHRSGPAVARPECAGE